MTEPQWHVVTGASASVTNPSDDSELEYFRGGQAER